MGRGGSGITYGKLQVVAEGESLEKAYEIFNRVMKEHGYPESKVIEFDKDEKDEDEIDDDSIVGDIENPDEFGLKEDDDEEDEKPVDAKKEAALKKISSAPWMRRKSG